MVCGHNYEHDNAVWDLASLERVNQKRREGDQSLPRLRWFAVLQTEGTGFVAPGHNVVASVVIGPTLAAVRCFAEADKVERLYDEDGGGHRRCACAFGDGTSGPSDLSLKSLDELERSEPLEVLEAAVRVANVESARRITGEGGRVHWREGTESSRTTSEAMENDVVGEGSEDGSVSFSEISVTSSLSMVVSGISHVGVQTDA